MILLNDVPFEGRARFLLDNICRFPDGPAWDAALSACAVDTAMGLRAYRDLLGRVYSDIASIAGPDDKARYLELVHTVHLLYAVFAFGQLVQERGRSSVRIDKTTLGEQYRKGRLAARKAHLEHHGFALQYLAGEAECASLSKASHLALSYDPDPALIPALKLFAERIASRQDDERSNIYPNQGIFAKADYETAFLQKPIPRTSLDPLREDILATVGECRALWVELADRLRGPCGLECSGSCNHYGSPCWGVSFAAHGQRPLAIFTLGSGIVFVEFTLPIDAAERIILERGTYTPLIRRKIESFGCVQCPKECKGGNLRKIDGVRLCSGRAEARRIYATLAPPDFGSIHAMLDVI